MEFISVKHLQFLFALDLAAVHIIRVHFATSNIYSSLLLNSLASHGNLFVEYLAHIN